MAKTYEVQVKREKGGPWSYAKTLDSFESARFRCAESEYGEIVTWGIDNVRVIEYEGHSATNVITFNISCEWTAPEENKLD